MLFKMLFNQKKVKELACAIAEETSININQAYEKHENKLDQITEVLHLLTNKVTDLEQRLNKKELQDRDNYGHMQYKISELKTDLSSQVKKSNN